MSNFLNNNNGLKYLDLFAGAGGLSEGFIRAGYNPVAHVELSSAASNTLKTRMSYHWLKSHGNLEVYCDYLNRNISRTELYDHIPNTVTNSVINECIDKKTLPSIIKKIDELLDGSKLDLIIGGPPCQAYSLVGRSRDKNNMIGDSRNFLYKDYAKFLRYYKPKYFIFENVTGLLSAKSPSGRLYLNNMITLFKKAGYKTEYQVLSANDYGVPQKRKRVVLVGHRGKNAVFYPSLNTWNPGITVKEILKDMPSIQAGGGSITPRKLKKYSGTYLYDAQIRNDELPLTWHTARPNTEQDLKIYQMVVNKWNKHQERLNYNDLPERLKTHKNTTSFTDRFKVVASDLPHSHTVVAHISKDGHYYIHPDLKQNRSITPREAARIQTFPDDYFFESESEKAGRTSAFHQIGNAVPVLMAQKIAESLKESW